MRLLFVAALLHPAVCFSPTAVALPKDVTPRAEADAAHAHAAELARKFNNIIKAPLVRKKYREMVAQMKALNKARKEWSLSGFATYFYTSFTFSGRERYRKLQQGQAYLEDMAGVLDNTFGENPTINSFDAMWRSLSGLMCTGTSANAALISALVEMAYPSGGEGLTDSGISQTQFTDVASTGLTCACSSTWDWSTSQHVALFSTIRALIDNQGATQVNALVDAVGNALPVIMGTSGMCAGTCQTAIETAITMGMDIAVTALNNVVIPARVVSALPGSVTQCMCGIDYLTMATTIIGYWGPSLYDSIQGIGSNDQREVDRWIIAEVKSIHYIYSGGFMCSAACRNSFANGFEIMFTVGLQSLTELVSSFEGFPSLPTNLMPTEADVLDATPSLINCYCNMNYTKFAFKVMEYVGADATGVRSPPTLGDDIIDMVEDIMKTTMNGTDTSGGWCERGFCPTMLGKMMSMFMPLGNYFAELDWNTVGTHSLESGVIFSSGILTTDVLQTLTTNGPHCFCSYFAPGAPGNVFPLLKRLASGVLDFTDECVYHGSENAASVCVDGGTFGACCAADGESEHCATGYSSEEDDNDDGIDDNGHDARCSPTDQPSYKTYFKCCPDTDSDPIGDIFGIAKDVFRATQLCGSGACRTMFDTVFALADTMINNAATQAALCTQDNARTCTSSCFPLDYNNNSLRTDATCSPCYTGLPQFPQVSPMSRIGNNHDSRDKDMERYMFWTTCYFKTDCPPANVAARVVRIPIVVQETVESFTETKQVAVKEGFVTTLDPDGLLGLTAGNIELVITAGSLNVEASITVVSPTVADEMVTTARSLSPAQLTTNLGVVVDTIEAIPAAEDETFASPAPPPPPNPPGMSFVFDATVVGDNSVVSSPPPPPSVASGLPQAVLFAIIGGASAVVVIIAVVIGVVIGCMCMRAKKNNAAPKAGGTGTQMAMPQASAPVSV
jgi:hypothetical protein